MRNYAAGLPQKLCAIVSAVTGKAIVNFMIANLLTAQAPPLQLVIPEAFRGLPVYTLAMNKSKILKGMSTKIRGVFRSLTCFWLDTFVSADVRSYYAHKMLASSARGLIQYLYPPLMSLHDLNQTIALPDPVTGHVKIPSLIRNSHMFMGSNGVYLIGGSCPVPPFVTGGRQFL